MRDEPIRPKPSESVAQWLECRRRAHWQSRTELRDAPEDVLAWAEAFERWRVEHEAWRATKRIDADQWQSRWRMLGGPWIRPDYITITGDVDGERWTVQPYNAACEAAGRLSDEAFTAWAMQFYELHHAEERARGALARHVHAGYAPCEIEALPVSTSTAQTFENLGQARGVKR